MQIIYMLYNADSKQFFLSPNRHKEGNIVTPSVFCIQSPEDTLPDVDKFQYLIRKDVFEHCAIQLQESNDICSFSTITYNGERCFMFIVDVTEYAFRKEKPNVYPVQKDQLLQYIDDIRALAIYARFSLIQKI